MSKTIYTVIKLFFPIHLARADSGRAAPWPGAAVGAVEVRPGADFTKLTFLHRCKFSEIYIFTSLHFYVHFYISTFLQYNCKKMIKM